VTVELWSRPEAPFPPFAYGGATYTIGQANNALVFPGLGLGTIVTRARTVSDGMLLAAADAVGGFVDASESGAATMPPIDRVREVSGQSVTNAESPAIGSVAAISLDKGSRRNFVGAKGQGK